MKGIGSWRKTVFTSAAATPRVEHLDPLVEWQLRYIVSHKHSGGINCPALN